MDTLIGIILSSKDAAHYVVMTTSHGKEKVKCWIVL